MTDDEIRETIEILKEPNVDLNFAMTPAQAIAVLEELLAYRRKLTQAQICAQLVRGPSVLLAGPNSAN